MGKNESEIIEDSQKSIAGQSVLPEEEQLRAQMYGLLARLLAAPMNAETIQAVRELEGGEGELGEALATFSGLAKRSTESIASEEYTLLFYGHGAGGELLPYASHYLTGFLYEKPLADIRKTLSDYGIARAEGTKEPEDHIAFLCEVMHGLIMGTWGSSNGLSQQKSFFETHIAPWAGRFFSDLERAESAALYMPLGTIGRLFMTIEAEAFCMTEE